MMKRSKGGWPRSLDGKNKALTNLFSRPVLIGVALAILFMVAASLGVQDEVAEADYYNEMVSQGHWPDYKEVSPECPQ